MEYKKIVPTAPAEKGEFVALDIEMFNQDVDRLHIPHGDFACLSIAYSGGAYQVSSVEEARHTLQVLKAGQWVFHNSLYDINQLRRFFNIAPRPIWDTMLVERVLYGGYYSNFALDDLARRHLGVKMDKSVRDTFSKAATVMTKAQSEYAMKDAVLLLKIAEIQKKLLIKKLGGVYNEIDAPMIWCILDMQPVKVDVVGWEALVKEFEEQARQREDALGFNTKSPAQVKQAVKTEAHVELEDTRAETLNSLVGTHPIFKQIVDARAYRTAISNFGRSWLEKNVDNEGLVHPAWRVTGAETGRMSCASPNLQQIPARNVELGMQRYRNMFVSRHPGGSLLIYDVAQQEPRITAYMTQDPTLLEIIKSGGDIHQLTADRVAEKRGKPVSRDDGKTLGLGLTYGLSEHGLAARTGMSVEEAGALIRDYFRAFSGVAAWIALSRNKARNDEFVETAAGRKIHINHYSFQWENNAINAPIQGGAADHTKLAVVNLWKACRKAGLDFPVCMVVHDEVVLDCPKGTVTTYAKLAKTAWLDAAAVLFPGVPFVVEKASGPNWGAKQEE